VLRGIVTVFWSLFLVDGMLSIASEGATLATGSSALSALRSVFAFSVLATSLLMVAMVALTPTAPRRILVPLVLFAWWAGPGMGFPLGFWNVPHLALGLAVGQVLLAITLWYSSRSRNGAPWSLPFRVNQAPAFSWRHVIFAAPLTAVVFGIFAGSCILLGFSAQIESLTAGYVRVRPDGIYLVERKFQSGDREVRLAGMMHVARKEFYSGLLPPVDPEVPSVVLVEGVTDRKRLLGGQTLDYGRLAKLLNVTSQSDSVFSDRIATELARQSAGVGGGRQEPAGPKGAGIYFKHADVDIESFHPKTIAFILAVMAIFQSNDLRELIGFLVDPSSPIGDAGAQEQVVEDILVARNQRLVAEIESSLEDYRCIVVPWGAMHLPEVESWLRERNFVQRGEVARKALGFW
jgi:hypothetical protein